MKISNIKDKIISLASIVAIVVIMYCFEIPCLFKFAFDIPCPGCGMTRAYLSLIKLDFIAALNFHPMFWSIPLLGLLYLFDGKLFKSQWLNYLIIAAIFAGFILCWIINLIGT